MGKMVLAFTGCREELCLGKTLDDASWKFVKAELKVLHGDLTLLTTWGDSLAAPVTPERPGRILGADIGQSSLLAVADNFGAVPFIIDGRT